MKLLKSVAVSAVALALTAGVASAQKQEGLVNIQGVSPQVAVPIGIAAQVCGVNVEALQVTEGDVNTVTCPEGGPNTDIEAYQNFVNRGEGSQGKGQGNAQEQTQGQSN